MLGEKISEFSDKNLPKFFGGQFTTMQKFTIFFLDVQIVPSAIFTFASVDQNEAKNSNLSSFFMILRCAM